MRNLLLFSVCIILISCALDKSEEKAEPAIEIIKNEETVQTSDSVCRGIYRGIEFDSKKRVNGDIAHQYSNHMSKVVGDQLKKLYSEGKYSKVDFKRIEMSTKGMNDGNNYVVYELIIPFVSVENKCDAMTSFDHCGGWGHAPAIEKRKAGFYEKGETVMVGNILEISDLKTTKEGLQEYWLQWKHVDFQSECGR